MKSVSIIVAILLVVAIGIMLFNTNPSEKVMTPEVTKTQETQTTSETPTTVEHGMTAEEHAAMMGEASMGTDIGMEMPQNPTITDTTDIKNIPSPKAKMFMVNGTNFAFDVKEIRVQEGDIVTIHFMSDDGFHDLVIDEFNARTEKIKTGGMAMMTFVASKKGTFEYYCSVGQHRMNGMVGKLIVE